MNMSMHLIMKHFKIISKKYLMINTLSYDFFSKCNSITINEVMSASQDVFYILNIRKNLILLSLLYFQYYDYKIKCRVLKFTKGYMVIIKKNISRVVLSKSIVKTLKDRRYSWFLGCKRLWGKKIILMIKMWDWHLSPKSSCTTDSISTIQYALVNLLESSVRSV